MMRDASRSTRGAISLHSLPSESRERVFSPVPDSYSLEDVDPNLVTLDDAEDPRKWPLKRRWTATILVSLVTFLTPMTASMIAPAAIAIALELHIRTIILNELIFSIFLLGYVIGPLFLGPLSEVFGRTNVLQLATWWFLIFNFACALARTQTQLLIFRLLAGVGACAPLSIVGGIISDLWAVDERAKAMSLYAVAPLLGPSLGPIMGAWITQYTTWRWTFYATTLFGAVVQLLIHFILPETYVPRLLHLKAERARKLTGNQRLHTVYEGEDQRLSTVLPQALIRVVLMLATEPIVQFLSVYLALIQGVSYLTLCTFPLLWTLRYHQTTGIAGLNYLSLTVGAIVGAQVGLKIIDAIYNRLKDRAPNKESQPEFRIPIIFFSVPLSSGGLFLYGWAAERHFHWIVPNIGAVILSAGMTMTAAALQMYNIDSYALYSASALGATSIARSMTGFAFPLFGVQMMRGVGWGWGNSILALIFLPIGWVGAAGLWFYGRRLREHSRFTKYG